MAPYIPQKITAVYGTHYGFTVSWTERGHWGFRIWFMPADSAPSMTGCWDDLKASADAARSAARKQCLDLENMYRNARRTA